MVRAFLRNLCRTANAEEISDRILDERKTTFPYTDEQAQRFMQVYRDLKSCDPFLPSILSYVTKLMSA